MFSAFRAPDAPPAALLMRHAIERTAKSLSCIVSALAANPLAYSKLFDTGWTSRRPAIRASLGRSGLRFISNSFRSYGPCGLVSNDAQKFRNGVIEAFTPDPWRLRTRLTIIW